MPPTTVIFVTDTHLSPRHGHFCANWRRVVDRLSGAEPAPALVVNGGDLSVDGAADPADLRFAWREHSRLAVPWRVVPGNHDVGESHAAVDAGQPVDPHRLQRWGEICGGDRWSVDLHGWRLVGFDCFRFGSGIAGEEDELAWLSDAARTAPGPVGLFVHKPLFLDDPADTHIDGACVTPEPRQRLLDALAGSDVRFVASGHVHQYRARRHEGVEHIWGPSTAFVASNQRPGARSVLGWVRLTLDGDRHEHRLETLEELEILHRDEVHQRGRYGFLSQAPPRPPEVEDTIRSGRPPSTCRRSGGAPVDRPGSLTRGRSPRSRR